MAELSNEELVAAFERSVRLSLDPGPLASLGGHHRAGRHRARAKEYRAELLRRLQGPDGYSPNDPDRLRKAMS